MNPSIVIHINRASRRRRLRKGEIPSDALPRIVVLNPYGAELEMWRNGQKVTALDRAKRGDTIRVVAHKEGFRTFETEFVYTDAAQSTITIELVENQSAPATCLEYVGIDPATAVDENRALMVECEWGKLYEIHWNPFAPVRIDTYVFVLPSVTVQSDEELTQLFSDGTAEELAIRFYLESSATEIFFYPRPASDGEQAFTLPTMLNGKNVKFEAGQIYEISIARAYNEVFPTICVARFPNPLVG